MNNVSDLAFFSLLLKHGSLAKTAQELGVTPPVVTKRLASLENRLGVRLLNRTTRSMSVTHEGEIYARQGAQILADVEELEHRVSSSRALPKGLLRVNATFGFGRKHIAPAVSDFVKRYPEVELQLQMTERPMNLPDSAFDIGIRVGELSDARISARKIASNRRLLCASPLYLEKFGSPKIPQDLQRHNCIVIRENDAAYGTWNLGCRKKRASVKVGGKLSTNDGETALGWAIDGHGIIMRSEWDAAQYLRSGRLCTVLDNWILPSADIFAVYPDRLNSSAKLSAFVRFLSERFKHHIDPSNGSHNGW